MHFFNKKCIREFYTNKDYIRVGGRKQDFSDHEDSAGEPGEEDREVEESEVVESVFMAGTVDGVSRKGQQHRNIAKKGDSNRMTSGIGNMAD